MGIWHEILLLVMVLAKVTLKDLKKIKNVRKHFEDWKTETQKFHNFYFLSPELVHFGKKLWDLTSKAMKTAKKMPTEGQNHILHFLGIQGSKFSSH